jgi:HRDC domain
MSLHCFFIPARAPEPAQSVLNAWLAGGVRVLALHREWVSDGPLPEVVKVAGSADRRRGADIDYRQVLAADDLALYARLRTARKGLAQRDGVPRYAVCSSEQLAALVTRRVATLADIEDMGPARGDRYGADPATVDQPLLQRPLGSPQRSAPEQAGPEPRVPACPELLRLYTGRHGWSARRLQRQDQSLRPVLRRTTPGGRLKANRKGPGGLVGRGCRRTPPGWRRGRGGR